MGYIIDFNDKIVTHRYDLTNNIEVKKITWQLYPKVNNDFIITKPKFIKKDIKTKIIDLFTYLTFSRAVNNDIIHSYKLITDDKIEQLYYSDFCFGETKKNFITLQLFNIDKGKHNIKFMQ